MEVRGRAGRLAKQGAPFLSLFLVLIESGHIVSDARDLRGLWGCHGRNCALLNGDTLR